MHIVGQAQKTELHKFLTYCHAEAKRRFIAVCIVAVDETGDMQLGGDNIVVNVVKRAMDEMDNRAMAQIKSETDKVMDDDTSSHT